MRELQHDLFGHIIMLWVNEVPVGRQLTKAIAVGVDKQSVPGTGHANVIPPH